MPSVSRLSHGSHIRQVSSVVLHYRSADLNLVLENLTCDIYNLPSWTWPELLANPLACQDLRSNFEAKQVTIMFNPNQDVQRGSFKMALTNCVTSEVVVGVSANVCLKRCFDRSSSSGIMMLPADRQYQELSRELNCIQWAKVMLDMVYDFVAKADEVMGVKPSFDIPQLRFVDAALVVAMRKGREELYMMEELIAEAKWPFHKYICNNSTSPLLVDPRTPHASEKNVYAQFLSFAQHVQYVGTEKHAFTSDFQGAGQLLTDPQIITDP